MPTVTGEIRRHFRDHAWAMRVPRRLKDLHGVIPAAVTHRSTELGRAPRPSEIARHLDATTAEVLDALQAANAYRPRSLDRAALADPDALPLTDVLGQNDPGFEFFIACRSLAPHLAALPARERNILIMRFYQDMTQTQIAERVGVSRMHVSRILATTLTGLREAVNTPTTEVSA